MAGSIFNASDVTKKKMLIKKGVPHKNFRKKCKKIAFFLLSLGNRRIINKTEKSFTPIGCAINDQFKCGSAYLSIDLSRLAYLRIDLSRLDLRINWIISRIPC